MASQSSLFADPRVRNLFERALQMPSAARATFVEGQARGDLEVMGHVLSLLQSAEDRIRQSFGMTLEEGSNLHGTATFELLQKLAVAAPLDTVRYRIEGQIGRGGMGAVMSVRDAYLNRQLAMKLMLDLGKPQDDFERQIAHQMLGRFLEEAQVTSQLDHPGVVPVHELGIDDAGKVYFTMRLVRGETLKEVFEKAAHGQDGWTRARALEAMLKVCDTIAYAHSKGVLHRDLKPANVMVGRFGEVYVMDWGLAKVLGQEDRHDLRIREESAQEQEEITVSARTLMHTARRKDADTMDGASIVSMDGQQLGTPTYMAPEQARSEPLDERADIYALGAMLYTLLAGRAPYVIPGKNLHAYRVLEMVVEGPPERLESIAGDVPAELVAIVDRAMARNKVGRYQKVEDLAADLRAYLDGKVVQAYQTGAIAEMRMWVRRNKPLALSVATAAMLLVVGVVVSVWFGRVANAKKIEAEVALEGQRVALSAAESARAEAVSQKEAAALAKDDAVKAKIRAETATEQLTDAKARLEESFRNLKTQMTRFDQLKGVVDYGRLMAAADQLYVPRSRRIEAMQKWLDEARQVLAQRADFERELANLRTEAEPVDAVAQGNLLAAIAQQRVTCHQLEVHLAWLDDVEAVRRDPGRFKEPSLPPALARRPQEAIGPWFDRLMQHATAHSDGMEFGNKQLGEPTTTGVTATDALAVFRELVRQFESGTAQHATLEVDLRRHLAWALAASGRLDLAQAQLDSARARCTAWSETDREQNDLSLDLLSRAIATMPTKWELAYVARDRAASALRRARTELTRLESQHLHFSDPLSHFLFTEVTRFLANLDALEARRQQVEHELGWAQQLHALPSRRPEAWTRWSEVENDVRSDARYRDIDFGAELRLDLVPIGKNPRTGLWEFYDLRSAWDGHTPVAEIPIPRHDSEGNIPVAGSTGVVFVLLPAGEFTAEGASAPTRVNAFLIARHELTQGQWSRLWRGNPDLRLPSAFAAGTSNEPPYEFFTNANPVESVDWLSSRATLLDNGMGLPTEAQWEYACRAGTPSPWAFVDLSGACNVADKQADPRWGLDDNKKANWDDGHRLHARVGSFLANPWGLHDMHGNVYEWCDDGDGTDKAVRGGSYYVLPEDSRSSARQFLAPNGRQQHVGVRAVRALQDG